MSLAVKSDATHNRDQVLPYESPLKHVLNDIFSIFDGVLALCVRVCVCACVRARLVYAGLVGAGKLCILTGFVSVYMSQSHQRGGSLS